MKRIEDPFEVFLLNKVPVELRPPEGWESQSKFKQIKYLNIPSFVIEMKKVDEGWSFGGNIYREAEPAASSYLVHTRNWIAVDSEAIFDLCTFTMLDQIPSTPEFDIIEGKKYYYRPTETHREECLQVAQSITIEQIISHSEERRKRSDEIRQHWMEVKESYGVDPLSYALLPSYSPESMPLLQRAYEALGIDKIRKILERAVITGGVSGLPDLAFIVREGEDERIVFVEVKTAHDRLRNSQFEFIRNFRDGAKLDYQIAHLHTSEVNGMHEKHLAGKQKIGMNRSWFVRQFGQTPPENEVKWDWLDKEATEHALNGKWGLYRNTQHQMAEVLSRESKLKQALSMYCWVCYLDINGPRNTWDHTEDPELLLDDPPFSPQKGLVAPGIISRMVRIIEKLNLDQEEIFRIFREAVQHDPMGLKLPVQPEDAWQRLKRVLLGQLLIPDQGHLL